MPFNEIIRDYIPFNYHPENLFKVLQESYTSIFEEGICVRGDSKKTRTPFDLEELEIFLEMCASLPFFVFKNNISQKKFAKVSIESEVIIKKIHENKDCLRSSLNFYPFVEGTRGKEYMLNLAADLTSCSTDDDGRILRRKVDFESVIESFTEEEIADIKFFPREVGYSLQEQKINLIHFKISKHLKKDDFPLFLEEPYINDFIEYTCFK